MSIYNSNVSLSLLLLFTQTPRWAMPGDCFHTRKSDIYRSHPGQVVVSE